MRVAEAVAADQDRIGFVDVPREATVEREKWLFLELIELPAAGHERTHEDAFAIGLRCDVASVDPFLPIACLREIVVPGDLLAKVGVFLRCALLSDSVVDAAVEVVEEIPIWMGHDLGGLEGAGRAVESNEGFAQGVERDGIMVQIVNADIEFLGKCGKQVSVGLEIGVTRRRLKLNAPPAKEGSQLF